MEIKNGYVYETIGGKLRIMAYDKWLTRGEDYDKRAYHRAKMREHREREKRKDPEAFRLKNNERMRIWNQENRERYLARQREYVAKNRERINEIKRRYKNKNKET